METRALLVLIASQGNMTRHILVINVIKFQIGVEVGWKDSMVGKGLVLFS